MIRSHANAARNETKTSLSAPIVLPLMVNTAGRDPAADHPFRLGLVSVEQSRAFMPLAAKHLTAAEKARGLRYFREIDRERFILGRYVVRAMLLEQFGIPPCDADFETGRYGKPYLRSRPDIAFSIAHSGDLVMVAMGHALQIGVDVEMHRNDIDLLAISQSVFTLPERKSVFDGSADTSITRFFRQWTQKEALTKALGTGLSRDPLRFEIEQDVEPLQATFVGDGPNDIGQDWTINSLDVAPHYSAAVVWRKT